MPVIATRRYLRTPMKPPCLLRLARIDDAEVLGRLLTELGHPASTADIEHRWSAWREVGNEALLAEVDGVVVGVLTMAKMFVLHRPRPVGRLSALVVTAACRGRGIGKALVHAAEAHLAAAGCGLVEVTSNERRAEAHALYQALGYRRTSLRFAKDVAADANQGA